MHDYAQKLSTAYNKATSDASTAIKGMEKTKLRNKKSMTHFLLDGLSERYSPIAKAAEELSELDYKLVSQDPKKLKTMLSTGEKQVKAFQQLKKEYMTMLDRILTVGIPMPDDDTHPVALKQVAPIAYRSVKLLKTEIEAVAARAVQDWEQYDKQAEGNEILAKGKKQSSKIEDDTERKDVKAIANAKQALLTFSPKLKSALAKGVAAVQKIKADPTPATYNKEMNNAGRDVSQNIVNIQKWRAHPVIKEFKAVKEMPDPGDIAGRIAAFGDGDRRTIADNATPAEVLTALKDYSAILKDVTRIYGDVLTGKLASKLSA